MLRAGVERVVLQSIGIELTWTTSAIVVSDDLTGADGHEDRPAVGGSTGTSRSGGVSRCGR